MAKQIIEISKTFTATLGKNVAIYKQKRAKLQALKDAKDSKLNSMMAAAAATSTSSLYTAGLTGLTAFPTISTTTNAMGLTMATTTAGVSAFGSNSMIGGT